MRPEILTGLARAYPPDEPAGGVLGDTTGSSPSLSNCACGGCVPSGSVSACGAIGDAPLYYRIPITDLLLSAAFGTEVIVTHVSSCTWQSSTFTDIDLGDGDHDYFFKLVFTGTGIEEATLTLEDET